MFRFMRSANVSSEQRDNPSLLITCAFSVPTHMTYPEVRTDVLAPVSMESEKVCHTCCKGCSGSKP